MMSWWDFLRFEANGNLLYVDMCALILRNLLLMFGGVSAYRNSHTVQYRSLAVCSWAHPDLHVGVMLCQHRPGQGHPAQTRGSADLGFLAQRTCPSHLVSLHS